MRDWSSKPRLGKAADNTAVEPVVALATPVSVSWPSSELEEWEVPGPTGSLVSSENELAGRIAAVDLSGQAFRPKLPYHAAASMPPASIFVGRDEVLQLLDDKLLPPSGNNGLSGLRSFALCGIGGVAKPSWPDST